MKTFLQFQEAISVDSSFVPTILNSIKSKLVGQDLGNLEVEQILNRAFAQKRIKFERGFGQSGDSDLSQLYIHQGVIDNANNIQIEYEDEFYTVFDDAAEWQQFVNAVQRIVEHELTHRHQIQRISQKYHGYKREQVLRHLEADPTKLSKYLGGRYEIPAFAREAVIELKHVGHTDEDIKDFLRHPFDRDGKVSAGDSNTLWLYIDFFEKGDPELKAFFKQMLQAVS
jgi:hypothetical protein